MHISVRSRWFAVLALLFCFCLPGSRASGEVPKPVYRPADFSAAALLVVHYHRPDGDYTDWNVWTWVPDQPGRAVAFSKADGFGRVAIIPFTTATERAGFIVRQGDWRAKDVDQDRFVSFDGQAVKEIWLVGADATIYTDPKAVDLTVKVRAAFLDSPTTVTVAATGMLNEAALQNAKVLAASDRPGADKAGPVYGVKSAVREPAPGAAGIVYKLTLDAPVATADVGKLSLMVADLATQTVYARDVLNDPAYLPLDATLGTQYSPTLTTFQTWSPVATSVELLLYSDLNSTEPKEVIALRAGDRGLWRTDVAGNLDGTPYRYRFTTYGKARTVADMHTMAASVDSSFSVVFDLDRLKPEGFDAHRSPILKQPTDEVIYEIHTRDYSIADDTCPPELRGTYLGLVHSAPATQSRAARGIDHLTSLGVTAVHLLPIHDFAAKVDEYNWGYWTSLFNVPESNYSTNPRDPTRAIVELRQTIQTLHKNNIRVILDVVYNHTSSTGDDSAFNAAVPYYYFRTSAGGQLLNHTGVGNTIADERPMVRKYILDSLKHWLTHYRVDGFRFDLIGTHNPETVKAITDALLPLKPDITLYGEPWTGGGPTLYPKGAQRNSRMALFNDNLRNAIRGDLDGTATGFATGPNGDNAALQRGIAGSIDDFTNEPIETINYVSAHDNLTLWDKLTLTHPTASNATKSAMQKLSVGIVLTSQGIPFLHGGCDFNRTKNGNHNSYNAGDAINAFDWTRKAQFSEVHDYTKGLIALRREHPAFRMSTQAEIRRNLTFITAAPLVSYTLNGTATNDSWKTIFVVYNGEPTPQTTTLPPGTWTVVVDHATAGTTPLRQATAQVTLPPYSMLVAHQ